MLATCRYPLFIVPLWQNRHIFLSSLISVLDFTAWSAVWMVAIGLYSGRQENPNSSGQNLTLPDLPPVYIPKKLTGIDIENALKASGQGLAYREMNKVTKIPQKQIKRSAVQLAFELIKQASNKVLMMNL